MARPSLEAQYILLSVVGGRLLATPGYYDAKETRARLGAFSHRAPYRLLLQPHTLDSEQG